ncbi:transcription termination factor Rho [Bacillus sp. NRRL B-14911]|nr:transcription termination factor Rho [Bacillus sp. NRRL B-14911]
MPVQTLSLKGIGIGLQKK